jgi:hypothetical protein
MDAVKEEINWSAVACRGFEEKLAELAAKKEKKAMADVIQRLRASKQRGADALFQQGYADGHRWASEQAEYDDLQRLEQFHAKRRTGRDWEKYFTEEPTFDPANPLFDSPVGERLMMVVCPQLSVDESGVGDINFDFDVWCSTCKQFWKSIVGEDEFKVARPSYIRGFAEGALALWSAVKDKL